MRRRAKLATSRLPRTSVGAVATGVNACRAPSIKCGGTPNKVAESALCGLGKRRVVHRGV